MSQYSSDIDTAEAELQQELREMFTVDTQQHLETYFTLIGQLNVRSWAADIQHLYRAIHTVKGGAVTVAAEGMLHTAIVLEDLLSDLRYLEQAPPLADRQLEAILLEAGELLSSSIEVETGAGDLAIAQIRPTVERLQQLRALVKQLYLPDWNELKLAHQEFAEQGFDLVTLELEMALAHIPDRGVVPAQMIDTARSTISQLTQIGVDLELAEGWRRSIEYCQQLVDRPDGRLWRQVWPQYFQILKTCIKGSGKLSATEIERLDTLAAIPTISIASSDLNQPEDASNFDGNKSGCAQPFDPEVTQIECDREPPDLLADFFFNEDLEIINETSVLQEQIEYPSAINFDALTAHQSALGASDSSEKLNSILDDLFGDEDEESIEIADSELKLGLSLNSDREPQLTLSATSDPFPDFAIVESDLAELDEAELIDLIEVELTDKIDAEPSDSAVILPSVSLPTVLPDLATSPVAEQPIEPAKRRIQIPVPLARLDKSAQQAIDTLLTARVVKNISTQLQSQLNQLTNLTQESSQFVTKLRQLQDDYALLRSLSDERDVSSSNVTLERYRQGYSTINRLLENILRMCELGQEIETVNYQSALDLDALDRSILRLKEGIETSRLVPFRNMTLRARAVLRDLTNRYGKPAELVTNNEHIELDAGIVQQLEPALLHLLRNAYDHGLETVPQRLGTKKPAQGLIQLSLSRRGNLYRLTIEDDGGGIDASFIHQIAKSKGFPLYKTRTNAELLAVLCQHGFSSSGSVNEISGRGVGMDVVVAQIANIGGNLSLETQIGQGTKFTIEVPAPQLLIPCVLLQVGERTVAIPTEEILETALMSSMMAEFVDDDASLCTWKLTTGERQISGFDLFNYWQPTQRSLSDTAICIRTRQAGHTAEIWSIADDLLGQAELLINPLPSPLIAPVGLMGVSLQPDGRMISILDPIALTAKIAATPNDFADYHTSTLAIEQSRSSTPTILIVDDAALMRRRFEASLTTHGFIVHTCNDGLEALTWLQSNPYPNLMITDVEMPNMDGFTLIDRCRQSQIDMPILVVSSRLSAEWGKEARRLGASDYLNKGFSTSELLEKVNSLMGLTIDVSRGVGTRREDSPSSLNPQPYPSDPVSNINFDFLTPSGISTG